MEYKPNIRLCSACHACLCGERPLVSIQSKNPEPKSLFSDPELSSDICWLCLGVHQIVFSSFFLDCLELLVIEAGYEFDSFSFSIRMPNSVKLRHAILEADMKADTSLTLKKEKGDIFDVKQSVKAFLMEHFVRKWSARSPGTEGLNITLVFDDTIQPQEQTNYLKDIQEKNLLNKNTTRITSIDQQTSYNLSELTPEQIVENFPIQTFFLTKKSLQLRIELQTKNAYIKGYYNKYSRNISQTPWCVDGAATLDGSIEEIIAPPICSLSNSSGYKFHTAGREDVDVRMLGNGRPFVVEVISPRVMLSRHPNILEQLADIINRAKPEVRVTKLHISNRSCFEELSHGAEKKVKGYCAIVDCGLPLSDDQIGKVNGLSNLEIRQATPLRVLHRRTLMNRDKKIHAMHFVRWKEPLGILFLLTSAGTYVKEFVHGDLQRTKPNFGTLAGVPADILQLDVLEIFEEYSLETQQVFDKLCHTLASKLAINETKV